jgi:2-haloacid dehalogenase
MKTLALDVYGTLIDPLGIGEVLGDLVGEDAQRFASAWRSRQLEYLFRRGLGRKYEPFSVCTRQALDHTCLDTGHDLSGSDRDALMARYLALPAFPEVASALTVLKRRDWRLFAFSNGEPDDLGVLLANAGLSIHLDGIVSVHEVRSYKPDPSVYGHFLENTGALLGQTWLVSGNPFDVLGAMEVGWKAAWVRRSASQVFDPWGVEPTAVVPDLSGLYDVLEENA